MTEDPRHQPLTSSINSLTTLRRTASGKLLLNAVTTVGWLTALDGTDRCDWQSVRHVGRRFSGFVATVTIIMLIHGPNVTLIVANSVAYASRYGLLTVAGTSSAMVVQVTLTALGMSEVLSRLSVWFGWIRRIGVAYLLYLRFKQWQATPTDLTKTKPEPREFGTLSAHVDLKTWL